MLKPSRKSEKKKTLSEHDKAMDWDEDRVTRARRSAKFGWSVAGLELIAIVALALALNALAPLKTVEPYIVRVDSSTGIVDTTSMLRNAPETYEEAIDNFYLAQYLEARESYSAETLEHDYRKVELMSGESVRLEYAEYMSDRNTNSPVNAYGRDGKATITVRSITHLEDGVAQVRFGKSVRRDNRSTPSDSEWIATITYEYINAQMNARDRLINPLGFQATNYRVSNANIGG